jgi:hypothetical protein
MSRYENNGKIPAGSYTNSLCTVGFDEKNRTFFLQITPWGSPMRHHLGSKYQEYTNLEIFCTAAALVGITFGQEMLDQLRRDQKIAAISAEQLNETLVDAFASKPGDVIDGWTCRGSSTPKQPDENDEPYTCSRCSKKHAIEASVYCSECSSDLESGDAQPDEDHIACTRCGKVQHCEDIHPDGGCTDCLEKERQANMPDVIGDTRRFIEIVADMAHNEPFFDTLDGETSDLVYRLGREEIAYDQVTFKGFMLLNRAIAKFKTFERLAGQPARKPICDECGSDNVMCDALASWNPETQSYELDNNFDTWQCFDEHTCDSNETKVEWVNADAVIERSVECNDCGAKSDDASLTGTVCFRCMRGMMSARHEVI